MRTKYDFNPLCMFSDEMYLALHNFIMPNKLPDKNQYMPIEPLLKKILLNNGCGFKDGAREKLVQILPDYILCFIIGGQGNQANEFFDFVELYGMQYLVVFLDNFKGIKTSNETLPDKDKLSSDEVISYGMNTLMGNSPYFDDIKKLTDVFVSTIYNPAIQTQSLAATAAASNYRWAGAIIAGKILNSFRPLTEYDIEGISLNDLMQLINSQNPLNMILSGVRQ